MCVILTSQHCFGTFWAFGMNKNCKSEHTYPLLTPATYQSSPRETECVCVEMCVCAYVLLCYVLP